MVGHPATSSLFHEFESYRVDAVTQTRGLWSITKDVPQMRPASLTDNLCTDHAVCTIRLFSNTSFVYGCKETRPSRP